MWTFFPGTNLCGCDRVLPGFNPNNNMDLILRDAAEEAFLIAKSVTEEGMRNASEGRDWFGARNRHLLLTYMGIEFYSYTRGEVRGSSIRKFNKFSGIHF